MPDVHLLDIFTALSLRQDKPGDYQLFKAIVRVAQHAGANPYSVDKLFWLIGSGYFHNDPHIGKKGFPALLRSVLMPMIFCSERRYRGRVLTQNIFTKARSAHIVDALFELIKQSLQNGEDVLINGFGEFSVKEKYQRWGTNPQTGHPMTPSAGKAATFNCAD